MRTIAATLLLAFTMSILPLQALADTAQPTVNTPKIEMEPLRETPVVKENKVPSWVWWTLLGVAVIGGGAAAAGGGGGGGGGSSTPATPTPTTSATVTWKR